MPTTLISDTHVSLLRRWALLSFVYFIIAGCMGAFLRLQTFHPVASINYKYFLHGHSHLAFLGWVFNALLVALLYAYLRNSLIGCGILPEKQIFTNPEKYFRVQ